MINNNFHPFPEIKSERLIFRQLQIDDAKQIFKIRSDKEMAKYLDRPLCKSFEEAEAFINKVNSGIAEGIWIYWGISLQNNATLIGTICLWKISTENEKAEIGFELLPDFQGQGIMQKAIPIILNYGFDAMNLKSIEVEVDKRNIKSIKLLERFNFVIEVDGNSENTNSITAKYTLMR
ncbi:MAG: GNAT family N-acetyltransferase [Melioribacteraceae bacterium]|nr:GNAT family N-acetyltransferase [Melioribacteraceae bacterium]MCF8356909.1 GNAT family N-acetyltransferase [Melioribacteraceae bacterium]MCF8396276.1 GNAT family N-acetyltransferase [Melioribacteraceae bacterium]MCF8420648.1 GNAT family N-acetyltransferase [Melioribacteraceae bacterium]